MDLDLFSVMGAETGRVAGCETSPLSAVSVQGETPADTVNSYKEIQEKRRKVAPESVDFAAVPAEVPAKVNQEEKEMKAYQTEEILAAATRYFRGDALAANVWMNKYALKDSEGHVYELTPDDMHHRIARELARIERKYPNPVPEEDIFELIRDFRYIIPQGSPMAGIGNQFQIASLSNCFVVGNEGNADSYGGIMKIDEEQVQLMKRRGGVGHDLSHIRPTGSPCRLYTCPSPRD